MQFRRGCAPPCLGIRSETQQGLSLDELQRGSENNSAAPIFKPKDVLSGENHKFEL